MREYLLYSKEPLDFPLDESIDVVADLADATDMGYLVSNTPNARAEVYAPEIDYYLSRTRDPIADRIRRVKILYDIRSTIFDGAQHFDYTQPVGDRLVIVSPDNQRDLAQTLQAEGFTAIWLDTDLVTDLTGHIGALTVTVRGTEGSETLSTDQLLWYNAPEFVLRYSGVYDPETLGEAAALETVRANRGQYHYKNFLAYDSAICQYHERLTDVCGKCEEVCPTTAILKIDDDRHLQFDPINCHGCGGCVSVCPSGALDYTQMPMDTFEELSGFFDNTVALIVPEQLDLATLDVPLAPGVLPLAIPGQKFLSEVHLLTLLQKSGQPVIFYSDVLSKGTGDAITILNEIFERKYHTNKGDPLLPDPRRASLGDGADRSDLRGPFRDGDLRDEKAGGLYPPPRPSRRSGRSGHRHHR